MVENSTVPPQLCVILFIKLQKPRLLCPFVYRTIFLETNMGRPKPVGTDVSMAFMSALNPP